MVCKWKPIINLLLDIRSHFDEPKAIEVLKPFLIARGVPGAEAIPERVRYNPLIKI